MGEQRCGTCAYFKSHREIEKEYWEEYEHGTCIWQPPELAFSWRFTPRKVCGVCSQDGAECSQWKPAESE
jgi:hypothetical protein